jgi:hypothetical protein
MGMAIMNGMYWRIDDLNDSAFTAVEFSGSNESHYIAKRKVVVPLSHVAYLEHQPGTELYCSVRGYRHPIEIHYRDAPPADVAHNDKLAERIVMAIFHLQGAQ